MDYKKVKNCRACGSRKLNKYLDLGKLPLVNGLLDSPKQKFKKYPLQVFYCENCSLSQLSIVVDPNILYKNYPYHSSVSRTFLNHCDEMAHTVRQVAGFNFSIRKEDGVRYLPTHIDVASNDGALMDMFVRDGYRSWGVEPSGNLCDIAKKKGHAVVNAFWGSLDHECLGRVDVITATNVFAHVDDVVGFIQTAKNHLNNDGVLVIEVPHLKNLIEDTQFDTIYHEHLSYFLLKPLFLLFLDQGLPIFRVEEHAIHGGSLRIYASRNRHEESSVEAMLNLEKDLGLYKPITYKNFSWQVEKIKHDLMNLLKFLKNNGRKVMGYGASAKGINLMNYCGVNASHIMSVVDDTPQKQGKIIPGCGIQVVSGDHFDTNHPDYIALLSWNFSKELMDKTESHKLRGGKYIIPIPEVIIQ